MAEKLVYFLLENFSTPFLSVLLFFFSLTFYKILPYDLAFVRAALLLFVSTFVYKYYTSNGFFLGFSIELLLTLRLISMDDLVFATQLFIRLLTLCYGAVVVMSIENYKVTYLEYYLINLVTVLGLVLAIYCNNLLLLHVTVELISLYVFVRSYYY